jgi:hypothetical protein
MPRRELARIRTRRPHRKVRPNPSPEPSSRSIFSEPAIQLGLLRAGALIADAFVPGVSKIVENAIDQAMKPRIVEAVAKQDLTELKPGPDGVYRADPA